MRIHRFLALMLAILGGWLALPAAHATQFRSGPIVTIGPDEVINDDLMVSTQRLVVHGTIRGDLIAIANSIQVPGQVAGSAMLMAQTVDFPGAAGGSVRIAGQTVTIAGQVGRNAELAAQNLTTLGTARVTRDMHVAAQTVGLNGSIGGSAAVAANAAEVGATIGQGLHMEGGTLSLTPTARVRGDVTVRSSQEPRIAQGATVTGQVRRLPAREHPVKRGPRPGWGFSGALFSFLAMMLAGAIGLALVPHYLRSTAEIVREQPGGSVLTGLVALIVLPILALLLAFTLIGLPLSLLVWALWLFLLIFSAIPVGIFIGQVIMQRIRPGATISPYAHLAIGLAVLAVLSIIPLVGPIVMLAVALFGVGMFLLSAYRYARRPGPGPAPTAATA